MVYFQTLLSDSDKANQNLIKTANQTVIKRANQKITEIANQNIIELTNKTWLRSGNGQKEQKSQGVQDFIKVEEK